MFCSASEIKAFVIQREEVSQRFVGTKLMTKLYFGLNDFCMAAKEEDYVSLYDVAF